MACVILTIIGPDRPGLVRSLSETVASHGGNWLESRMAHLGGQFAGIVMVEAPETLLDALHGLEREGLHITATMTKEAPLSPARPHLMLEITGNDRPGIVHEVAEVLASHDANIEELTTDVVSGSFSGENLFRASISIRARDDASVAALRDGLERLGDEMMVDIQPINL